MNNIPPQGLHRQAAAVDLDRVPPAHVRGVGEVALHPGRGSPSRGACCAQSDPESWFRTGHAERTLGPALALRYVVLRVL